MKRKDLSRCWWCLSINWKFFFGRIIFWRNEVQWVSIDDEKCLWWMDEFSLFFSSNWSFLWFCFWWWPAFERLNRRPFINRVSALPIRDERETRGMNLANYTSTYLDNYYRARPLPSAGVLSVLQSFCPNSVPSNEQGFNVFPNGSYENERERVAWRSHGDVCVVDLAQRIFFWLSIGSHERIHSSLRTCRCSISILFLRSTKQWSIVPPWSTSLSRMSLQRSSHTI